MRLRTALALATVMAALAAGSVVAITYPWESAGASGGCMVVQDHTKCVGADLQGAHLEYVDLQHADLRGANLTGAFLTGAQLDDAVLTDANLTRADLTGATLERASLTGVTWLAAICPDGTSSASHGNTCANNLTPAPVTGVVSPVGPGAQAATAAAPAPAPAASAPLGPAAAAAAFTG